MCKLCTIEHSSSWTCEQALANSLSVSPLFICPVSPPETVPVLECAEKNEASLNPLFRGEPGKYNPPVAEKQQKLDRSAYMKEWWRARRAKG